jgi:hypothetical protein
LIRNAEKLNKLCDCELFILIHNKITDKIFSYNSDPSFDLVRVTDLILKDIHKEKLQGKKAETRKKRSQYKKINFTQSNENIQKIMEIEPNYIQNEGLESSDHSDSESIGA